MVLTPGDRGSTALATSHKLGSAEFRFLSAWVQGVEVGDAWSRYMGHRGSGDLRRIRGTVRTILDQLAAIARRHGDPATAALLRRDRARIKLPGAQWALPEIAPGTAPGKATSPASALTGVSSRPAAGARMPTLAEFAAELEDPSFYSEAELVALLEERYGKVASLRPATAGRAPRLRDSPALRAEKRRARLVMRQLDALRRLEALASTAPAPSDRLAAWLDPLTAKRLGLVGVVRLSELMFYVRLHGYRWYRKVPRIGQGGALRLVRWLGQHEATLGALPVTALVPLTRLDIETLAPRPSTGVVPIERLRLPSTLSGEQGTNRAAPARCRARARHDYAAVMEWLELRRPTGSAASGASGIEGTGNAHTWRAYRKEAERFLLWAVFEQHKALSSLDHLDCLAYRRFLAAPGPEWIGAKSVPRWSEHWRPFEGPLGLRSRRMAEVIVSSMCAWLTEVRYLDSNPWVQVPKGNRALPLTELRSLSDGQWTTVQEWLELQPQTPAGDRLRMMFSLALATGMRAAELAGARAGWLRQDLDEQGEPAWNLVVVGKGGKEREVPLTTRVTAQLRAHLAAKGLGDDFSEVDAEVPLLSGLADPRRGMTADRVYELMKGALTRCADAIEYRSPAAAQRIRRASPHWLRHTHGRKFVEGGGDRGVLRQNLGHASDATTAIYDRSEAKRRRREVEKVFG